MDLDSKSTIALANRGVIKRELNDYEGALRDYDEAIKIDPNDFAIYNNRAFLLLCMGLKEKALDDANTAISLNCTDYNSYDTRGQIYIAMDRNEDAMKDLNTSLSINPNCKDSLESRARCYRKLAEAEKDAEKKAELISKAEADEQKAEALKKEDKK